MKILFVSNLYGELARGGAERIVETEAEALAAAGDEVAVVSGERKREIPKGVCLPGEPWLCPPPGDAMAVRAAYAAATKHAFVAGKPRVIRYHAPNFYFYADDHQHGLVTRFFWHLRDMADHASARTFHAILDLERPDVVHTHNLMGLGFRLPGVVRAAGIRHVHTVHDVQLIHPSGLIADPHRSSLAQRAYVALMRRLMGSPQVVIFPSRYLLDLHERLGFFPSSHRVVVRNPAPAVSDKPRTAPAAPRFLFVGQLEYHKGLLLLLGAWRRAGLGGATLEIVGTGSAEAQVRAEARGMSGVAVSGKKTGDALMASFDAASYLVVPSLVIENQPTVILEAMSRGTPVVAAATGGIPELVREGESGFLFAAGDPDACAAAMRRAAGATNWPMLSAFCKGRAAEWGLVPHLEALRRAYRKTEK